MAPPTTKSREDSRRRDRRPRAHPGGGVRGVHKEWLCRHQHAGDRHARAGFETGALRAGWQQAGNADRLHQRARAGDCRSPLTCPCRDDRETLARVLASFGTQLVREISDPDGHCGIPAGDRRGGPRARGGASARFDRARGEPCRLAQDHAQAQASGLLKGRTAELAEQFGGLLWGNLMVSLLLGVAERPNPREIAARARDAAAAFLQLHPPPDDVATLA